MILEAVASEKLALYFGCLGEPGHYLHVRGSSLLLFGDRTLEQFPTMPKLWATRLMDCGLLENRKVPDSPDGRVHWTGGGATTFWFAFFWWDRSVDSRPGCNSGFYVHGFGPADVQAAFDYACEQWPDVVSRQRHPLVLVSEM